MKSKKQKAPFAKVMLDLRVIQRYSISNKELEDDIIKYLKTVDWTTDEYLQACQVHTMSLKADSSAALMNANPNYITKIGSYLDIN